MHWHEHQEPMVGGWGGGGGRGGWGLRGLGANLLAQGRVDLVGARGQGQDVHMESVLRGCYKAVV